MKGPTARRRALIAGNWKMHGTPSQAAALAADLRRRLDGAAAEIVLCPPLPALDRVRQVLAGSSLGLGAQNVFWEREGAFTGEVAAAMLAELDVRYVIVGHSERRLFFGETDETANRRARAVLAAGLTPILCVGERLEEREAGRTLEVVQSQLEGGLRNLTADEAERCVIAYEPVWAIGTGKVATPEQAQEVHAMIRGWLGRRFDASLPGAARVIYGGSVKPENAGPILHQPDIDGALVGGASLEAESFARIAGAAP